MARKPGRPSKLTAERQEELCRYIRGGNYLETAAALCGIDRDTVREWLKRGAREKTGQHVEFSVAYKKAEAFAEASAVQRIRQAGARHWVAEAWYLERKFPHKWGRWQRDVPPDESDVAPRVLALTTQHMTQPGDDEG